MSDSFDVAVIGAGMAGASIAAEVAPHARVLLAEAEDYPGYHTTGRSAAFWEQCYGGPEIVPLTLASGRWLEEHGMLGERGALYVARAKDKAKVDRFIETFTGTGVTIERIGRSRLEQLVPGLLPEWHEAILEPACADIDVAAVHQHYLAQARRTGVELKVRHRLEEVQRDGDRWALRFANGAQSEAAILVDAAGAWADPVARMAGARALGIKPLRRTVVQVRTNPPPDPALPLVLDISGEFYFRPENGRLWLSPHDETPSEPCDAAPEELDIALAIDRFAQVVDCRIEAVERKWAGLRSFAPDRAPVYGFDPRVEGFFWFAGQGGYGIQTAPAAARLGAQLLLGHDRDEMTRKLDASLYDPGRFG